MQCLVLAGGLGTRMWPATRTVPKALIPVAGRPFAGWQMGWLRSQGVSQVIYSVGHLGDQIERYVGDGAEWGLDVGYVREDDGLLGTGGAVRLAVQKGVVEPDFCVLYGDSYLQVDLQAVERAYRAAGLPALMTVYRNGGRWDRSNVCYRDGAIVVYDKAQPAADMDHIDYGLLLLSRDMVESSIGAGTACDLAPLLNGLSRRAQLAGFEATARFYEIGSPDGLADLERHLLGASPAI